jgi:hypothetical protein
MKQLLYILTLITLISSCSSSDKCEVKKCDSTTCTADSIKCKTDSTCKADTACCK